MANQAGPPRIRVLIADDYGVVREGIKLILIREPDISVVGEAESGYEAVALAGLLAPDIVLTEIHMAGLGGTEVAKRITAAHPKARVIALTATSDERYVGHMLQAGASGYVLKRGPAANVVQAIRAVHQGKPFLPPTITSVVIADYVKRIRDDERRRLSRVLTDREQMVLTMIATGRTSQDIAEELSISPGTVQTHVSNIMAKLDLHDRAALVAYAFQTGLLVGG